MKLFGALNKNIFGIGVIPFGLWLILSLGTVNELPKDLMVPFITFGVLFLSVVFATAWVNETSKYFVLPLSLLAMVPLYIESQSSSGDYTAKLFPVIAILFILFYSLLNFMKLRKLKKV